MRRPPARSGRRPCDLPAEGSPEDWLPRWAWRWLLPECSGSEARGGGDSSASTRLAVLPFENQGVPEDEYFADGMTDAVRAKLSAIPALQVTARQSSAEYKKSPKSRQADRARAGGAVPADGYGAMGEGRRRKPSASQSRAGPGGHVFHPMATAFRRCAERRVRGSGQIAGRVAQALDIALGDGSRRQLRQQPTHDLAAYDAYLKGQGSSQRDPAAIRRAAAYYEQAVALDSGFVLAWAHLSHAHSVLSLISTPTPAEAKQARQAGERALALAPDGPEGHFAMGTYYGAVVRDRFTRGCGIRAGPGDRAEQCQNAGELGRYSARARSMGTRTGAIAAGTDPGPGDPRDPRST